MGSAIPTAVRFTPEMKAKIEETARENGISMNQLVNLAIKDYLTKGEVILNPKGGSPMSFRLNLHEWKKLTFSLLCFLIENSLTARYMKWLTKSQDEEGEKIYRRLSKQFFGRFDE